MFGVLLVIDGVMFVELLVLIILFIEQDWVCWYDGFVVFECDWFVLVFVVLQNGELVVVDVMLCGDMSFVMLYVMCGDLCKFWCCCVFVFLFE